jgi:hypothetical protein
VGPEQEDQVVVHLLRRAVSRGDWLHRALAATPSEELDAMRHGQRIQHLEHLPAIIQLTE